MNPPSPGRPEILAPAGAPAVLAAALAAGAEAVYVGLRGLNARRGAANFSPEELTTAVAQAHAAGARVHLTLNIDLAERELALAARMLVVASQAGVDAVLVKDPALFALRPAFPGLVFHLSTQAGVSSSAGVAAAAALGCTRVVLARELTLDEIAASQDVRIEREVFVLGALCFACSGRCLLASWGGGRSGNRGLCTSPCRVPWTRPGAQPDRLLAMRDLTALAHLPALAACGVASLKLEGRLKSSQWVAQAVHLVQQARAGLAPATKTLAGLGEYTGRTQTDGYLVGDRQAVLGGDTGRQGGGRSSAEPATDPEPDERSLVLSLIIDADHRLSWTARTASTSTTWTSPLPTSAPAHRTLDADALAERLRSVLPAGWTLHCTAPPQLRLPRRLANEAAAHLQTWLQRQNRAASQCEGVVLPPALTKLLRPDPVRIGEVTRDARPDRLRLGIERVLALRQALPPATLVVEDAEPDQIAQLPAGSLVALPAVFYEAEIPLLRELCRRCREQGRSVEVNSLDGWWLARQAGVDQMEAGPGLGVLNHLAARTLADQGCRTVTASVEIDRRQLTDLLRACRVPINLIVAGRPVLAVSRAAPSGLTIGTILTDARGIRLSVRRSGSTLVFRPLEAFDWRADPVVALPVAHRTIDLIAAADPLAEWSRPIPGAGRFNLDRGLR